MSEKYYLPDSIMQKLRPNDHNLEDIQDLSDIERIRAEVQREMDDKKVEIETIVDEENRDNETIRKAYLFAQDTTEIFQASFWELLDQHCKGKLKISDRIVEYLRKKRFDLPKFTIVDRTNSERILQQREFDDKIEWLTPDSCLLIFNLPKPLDVFWWKSRKGGNKADSERNLGVIEWGSLYYNLMPTIWEQRDLYDLEKNLSLERINQPGQHEIGKYYYIWQATAN